MNLIKYLLLNFFVNLLLNGIIKLTNLFVNELIIIIII